MDIKQTLKDNKITQEEFALYLGLTRENFNIYLNHGKQKQSIIDSLKIFIMEKRGIKIDITL